MNSAAQFAEAFRKFKEAQPEFKTGFSFEKLSQWHEEFFLKVRADIRREAYTEAARIVQDWDLRHPVPFQHVVKAILDARDKIK